MSIGSRLLLVGLRGSGKTSYLAALWHLVEAGEMPTSLVNSQLQPDREHLNRIRDKWISFQEVGRTSLRSPEMVSLMLRDSGSGADINITVPDLSGELFRLQWANRRATRSYAEFAAESCGVLLLVHPAAVERSPRIPLPPIPEPSSSPDAEPVLGVCCDGTRTGLGAAKPKEWTPDLVPTQVEFVELLQFVTHLHSATERFRVALVVSAWDLVRDPILPVSWVESHLPLLSQFLVANADTMPFRTYGVSALGGDLVKDLERLQKEAVPSHRIKVVENSLEPHGDLTAPIRFLLALDSDGPKSV
jgi:hypothetical protein